MKKINLKAVLVVFVVISTLIISGISENVKAKNIKMLSSDKMTAEAKTINKTNIKKQKLENFFGADESISYKKSISNDDTIISDIYEDANSNQYIYDGDELVGFLKGKKEDKILKKQSSEKVLSLDEEANKIFKELAGDRENLYVLTKKSYVDSYDEYTYTYVRMINNIKTNDTIYISFNSNGVLMSFSKDRAGLFDNLSVKIDEQEALELIKNQVLDKYKSNDYDINDKFIDYVNDTFVISYYVGIQLSDNTRTAEIFNYILK